MVGGTDNAFGMKSDINGVIESLFEVVIFEVVWILRQQVELVVGILFLGHLKGSKIYKPYITVFAAKL